ncbi:MAG TPA: CpsB/CapC family capsule biosynthesis tyrosine phosphatase [Longimicrobiales bacterium]|nr:CpsB/CapC family capsule biosynthesis tyrosine phosphatase [Longimicrobiales bacterium]
MIDFHNHLLPGVDDGARNEAETSGALRALAAEGVRGVIVTPHVNASTTFVAAERAARLDEIGAAWPVLERCAKAAGVAVWPGAEIALDTPVMDFSDPRLRLNGTRFVLVEFAFMTVPQESTRALAQVGAAGWIPVLAHPERYRAFTPLGDLVREWRAAGARLQINGASLLGRYGELAQRVAEDLLARGEADYVCSDYHARGRPRVVEYRHLIERRAGPEAAVLLTETNPQRLLEDALPLAVPSGGEERALWRTRWRRFFR